MPEFSQTRADELPFILPHQYGIPRTTNPHTGHSRQQEIPSSRSRASLVEETVQRGEGFVSPPAFLPRIVLPQATVTGERTVPHIDADEIRYYSYPSADVIEEYIERGLLRLNKEVNDEEAVQRIVFQLITRARLTTDVFTKLRGMSF